MGFYDGDLLVAQLDEGGRLVLSSVEADPLRRLTEAGRGLWQGGDR